MLREDGCLVQPGRALKLLASSQEKTSVPLERTSVIGRRDGASVSLLSTVLLSFCNFEAPCNQMPRQCFLAVREPTLWDLKVLVHRATKFYFCRAHRFGKVGESSHRVHRLVRVQFSTPKFWQLRGFF